MDLPYTIDSIPSIMFLLPIILALFASTSITSSAQVLSYLPALLAIGRIIDRLCLSPVRQCENPFRAESRGPALPTTTAHLNERTHARIMRPVCPPSVTCGFAACVCVCILVIYANAWTPFPRGNC